MCGRFSLNKSKTEVEQFLYDNFSIEQASTSELPRYNIAPSQQILSIIFDGKNYRAGTIEWGLKIKSKNSNDMIINARAETLNEKPMFQKLLTNKRCLIIADGFYEWDKISTNKIPYRIELKTHSLFTMAGLWNQTTKLDGSKCYSCTIITTSANSLVSSIHDRMPVIFETDQQKKWLSEQYENFNTLFSYLQPFDEQKMMKYPISSLINNPKNDVVEVLTPIK